MPVGGGSDQTGRNVRSKRFTRLSTSAPIKAGRKPLILKPGTTAAASSNMSALMTEFPKGTYSPVFRFRTLQRIKLKSTAVAAIAVLPFESLTNSTPNESFGDGLTEELIHHLAQVPGLQIVVYQRGSQNLRRDERLQCRSDVTKWNLRGSIRFGDGMLRVIVQLIETSSGAYVWSETYDPAIGDLLSVQEGIARAVGAKLQLTLELSQINTRAS